MAKRRPRKPKPQRKSKKGINKKEKGNRRERQGRDLLLETGWHFVKAGGSLGVWDLVAVRTKRVAENDRPGVHFLMIQSKSNRPPSLLERRQMLLELQLYPDDMKVEGEWWVFKDYARGGPRTVRVTRN